MSGSTLAVLSNLLSAITGWRVQLMPGSFRGAPFYLDVAPGVGGRRIVTHQFAQLDTPFLEDLGQEANEFQLRVFVVGDDYMSDRDALISACQDSNTADVLVHPTLGIINCRAGKLHWTESPAEKGGYCAFDITFHKDGQQPAPSTDTLSQVLRGIGSMLKIVGTVYQTVSTISQNPALLVGFVTGLVGGAAGSLLGLAPSTVYGLVNVATAMTAAIENDGQTAAAVQTAFQDAAGNVVAAQTPPVDTGDPVLGTAPSFAPPADITGGLASLTTWGDTLPAPVGAGAALATLQAQQAAVVALVEGSAALAVITVYAQTNFTSANAATAARTQVLAMLDRQSRAANLAGNDDLYRAWLALGALTMNDLIVRAQNLPSLVSYRTVNNRSALVLAQLWYQDASRADELVALNDVPHPMFMPTSGVRLAV